MPALTPAPAVAAGGPGFVYAMLKGLPRMPLTDYEAYIRTDELLALQKHPDALTTGDEMQFQIMHQAAELWMKLCAFELGRVVGHLAADELPWAARLLRRVAQVQQILLAQLDLVDTMSPKDYMTIRTGLGRGSGQESPGFKTLLRLPGESIWPAVEATLARHAVTLREIYEHQDAHPELFGVCEALVDYDQKLQLWRQRHLMIVYRQIGTGTPSLKGKPSDLLAEGMKKRFFPALWAVRDEVFAEWTASMASKGKDTGYHG
jgi:tryptophan 2,3-dioxygenase